MAYFHPWHGKYKSWERTVSADWALAFQALGKKSFYPSHTRTEKRLVRQGTSHIPRQTDWPTAGCGSEATNPNRTDRPQPGGRKAAPRRARRPQPSGSGGPQASGPRSSAGPHQATASAKLGQGRRQVRVAARDPRPRPNETGNQPPA